MGRDVVVHRAQGGHEGGGLRAEPSGEPGGLDRGRAAVRQHRLGGAQRGGGVAGEVQDDLGRADPPLAAVEVRRVGRGEFPQGGQEVVQREPVRPGEARREDGLAGGP
ncbi:hypothetical protein ACGFJT_42470 [Actinomadura geliboluensis]|uniref:hypothetical protein n=1 Tax=Actinomadura geliboluensis TaxID=882440 RepID=UPI00371198D4